MFLFQNLLQIYSNQDSMIQAEGKTYRSMEQNGEPRNNPLHLCTNEFVFFFFTVIPEAYGENSSQACSEHHQRAWNSTAETIHRIQRAGEEKDERKCKIRLRDKWCWW